MKQYKELNSKKHKLVAKNKKAFIFVLLMSAYPLIHWGIFYVYANINSIALAFQRYDISSGKFVFLSWNTLFENFKQFFNGLFRPAGGANLGAYFLRGAITHLIGTVFCFPISLMFGYIIFKKLPLTGFFKIMLYLPSVLSGMIMALLFKYGIERALPALLGKVGEFPLLLSDPKYTFQTMLTYGAYLGMPGAIILTTGTMSRIPDELIESGRLEGITMLLEFRHIILPLMFPLLQVLLLGLFVGFFTASGPQHAIYAEYAPEETITFSYYMLTRVVGANATQAAYGFTAAANLSIGLISVPIVYGTKRLLDRFDPEAEY